MNRPVQTPSKAPLTRHPALAYLALAAMVVAIWCAAYRRAPGTAAFSVPVHYADDSLFVMGALRAFSELPPPWSLHIERLNAPFGADWNDYPHSEKLLYYFGGLLARMVDLGSAANWFLLAGFVVNAMGFFWAARYLGAKLLPAMATAIMFAFSPYMLWRSLPHSLLVYAGHIPLLFCLCQRLRTPRPVGTSLWLWASLYVVASAFLNPYYFIFILLALALVTAGCLASRRWTDAFVPASLVGLGAVAFVANQANVLLYRWQQGPNPTFSERGLREQLLLGLRLPDLFLPYDHPLPAWSRFAAKGYFQAGMGVDNTAAFLGLAGCAGLLALLAVSLARGMRGRAQCVPAETWFVLLSYLLGATGGVAMLFGVFGFSWLRASARYSIVITAAVLLWGSRAFRLPRWPVLAGIVWVGLAVFTVVESYASRFPYHRTSKSEQVRSDRAFAAELERRLPKGAAVFQIPPMGFPEMVRVHGLVGYELFRPYLWSTSLRFSNGGDMGRPRERWQRACATKPVAAMLPELRAKGFSAIVVHRLGFADRGRAIEAGLAAAGLAKIADSADGEMVAYGPM